MITLNLPQYPIKVTKRDGRTVVFDELRRKYVALTPEEWVRQHFVHYLVAHKHYPPGLVANEISLTLNGTAKRCDTVASPSARHCGIQSPTHRNHPKGFCPGFALQYGVARRLSHRLQRPATLLLQDGLRHELLQVPAGHT
jgi:hypothetical protein